MSEPKKYQAAFRVEVFVTFTDDGVTDLGDQASEVVSEELRTGDGMEICGWEMVGGVKEVK